MQITLVTETFPPEVNGVALTLKRLVSGLGNRRHKVTVVRPQQKGEASSGPRVHNATDGYDQWLVPGVPIPFYDSLRLGLPAGRMLRRRWQENRPDVVHIATEGPLGYSALKTALAMGIPVSSSFHTNFQQYGGHYGMRFGRVLALRYLRWFHNSAACTLVPTEEMRARLARFKFERLAVLSRGVDARLFAPAKRSESLRKTWGAESDDPVVIHVGRVAAEKNIELAVDTYQAIRLVNPRTRFVIVGDGPKRAALEDKHPEFIYAGTRQGEDLAAHYASADLFLFPSVTETFGNVVTEALSSGLVVAGYDYAAMRQHVKPGVNGYSVKLGDRAAFIQQGAEVIGQRAQWTQIRAAARITAQTISWDVIVAQFETQLAALGKKK